MAGSEKLVKNLHFRTKPRRKVRKGAFCKAAERSPDIFVGGVKEKISADAVSTCVLRFHALAQYLSGRSFIRPARARDIGLGVVSSEGEMSAIVIPPRIDAFPLGQTVAIAIIINLCYMA